jgi:hypothetical protein
MDDRMKRIVRAIFGLKSPPPAGSQHYRSGWDDGLDAAIDAAKNATPESDETPARLTDAERAMLRYALGLAEERMFSRGDEFTDEDEAAVKSLKRLAGEEGGEG